MREPPMHISAFWETAEAVERFGSRAPDHRLARMIGDYPDPARIRVLDLGCAGGRNTALLAEAGFDVFAVDSSTAMVTHTRARLAASLGEAEAERRVRLGVMQDLSAFDDDFFQLVVALGVFHQAESRAEWEAAVREAGRVLAAGGLLLHAAWCPRTQPDGRPLEEVPGQDSVYLGPHSGRHYLLDAQAHDVEMEALGFPPEVPAEEVRVATERGERVTINGLYRRSSF